MSRSVYGRLKAGEFEGPRLAKERLEVIIPISLVLIMVLLYWLFNSLRDSFLALVGIPFAVSGGVLALYFTGLDFSISSAIGFVSLFGVSVMDGILIGSLITIRSGQPAWMPPNQCSTPRPSGCGRC